MREGKSGPVHPDRMPGVVGRLRRVVFGRPYPSHAQTAHRLPVFLALPVFASDALSSVAYATEEILIVLAGASLVGGERILGFQLPVTLAIAALIIIVVTSYRLAIAHYPTSGGSYTVAKNNLGEFPGLIAAAALAIDYIMTVAVSVSAGVAALTSAFPAIYDYRVYIAVLVVVFIALVNLRGVRESGWTFALPAYSFIVLITLLIGSSIYHYMTGTLVPAPPPADPIVPVTGLGVIFIMRAFANGCSAMTGVEAVSNGVSAFKVPEVKNAQATLMLLAGILVFMFLGIGFAAHAYHIIPSHTDTVVSQIARANFGNGMLYYLTAYATLAVLMVAANTSYADFPRLLSIVARDGYAPRIFTQLGDRLVFNRGIYTLTLISIALIVAFQAKVNALIPLYAVGVFLCFTMSQLGMARKVSHDRKPGWQRTSIISLTGAVVTGAVTVIIIQAKFIEGAWVVMLLIPILVLLARLVKQHYDWFARMMKLEDQAFSPLCDPAEPLTVISLISDLNRGALEGLDCALDIAGGRPGAQVRAVHIEMVPEFTERFVSRWRRFVEPYVGKHVRLEIVPSPYRWLIPPVLEYIDKLLHDRPHDRVVIIIPEFETGNWITHLLHNASARRLYQALLDKPRVTIVSCRFFMRPRPLRIPGTPLPPPKA